MKREEPTLPSNDAKGFPSKRQKALEVVIFRDEGYEADQQEDANVEALAGSTTLKRNSSWKWNIGYWIPLYGKACTGTDKNEPFRLSREGGLKTFDQHMATAGTSRYGWKKSK